MYKVAYITDQQARELIGIEWCDGNLFAPAQHEDGKWYISSEEVYGNENKSVAWVNGLELSDFTPVEIDIPQ
jgi:hypothetical protein